MRLDEAMGFAAASWTNKSLGPSPGNDLPPASFLITIEGLKLRLRETLLELNAVTRHSHLPRSALNFADHNGAMRADYGA
jgi:hypothetical protein